MNVIVLKDNNKFILRGAGRRRWKRKAGENLLVARHEKDIEMQREMLLPVIWMSAKDN